MPRSPSPWLHHPAFLSGYSGIPKAKERYNLSRVFWVPPGPLPVGHVLNILLRRHPEGILVKGLNHLFWLRLMWKNTGFTLSPSSITRGTVPDFYMKLRRHVNQDIPQHPESLKTHIHMLPKVMDKSSPLFPDFASTMEAVSAGLKRFLKYDFQ